MKGILLACLGSIAACAAFAAAPGGEGTIFPPEGRAVPTCFNTGSTTVPEICGQVQVRWKLSALMGEPVANFGLVWSLNSVRVRSSTGVGVYAVDRLPAAVALAARRSQLMVIGLGTFQGPQGATLAVEVDTGAPSRPDGKVSFNVPGSPNWDRFIINGSSQSGAAPAAWCEEKGRSHLEPARAKDEMRQGVRLSGLLICPRTTVSVDALERALEQHCKTTPQANWCEAKPETTTRSETRPGLLHGDMLDRAADKPQVQRTHARLVEAFRRDAQAACGQELAPVNACLVKACPVVAGPAEEQCRAVPGKPSRRLGPVLTSSDSGPCNARCEQERAVAREASRRRQAQEERELDEARAAWDTRWGDTARECSAQQRARSARNQCLRASESACNPAGLTVERCVERRMAQAPDMAAARSALEKDIRNRQRSDQPASRFLD